MYNLIFLLEMLADDYKKIAIHLLEMRSKPNPLLVKEFEIFKDQVRRFYNLFYTFSKKTACEIYEADEEADKFLEENYTSFSDKEKEIIHHLKKIGAYVLSLTELRIDLSV